MTMRVRPLSPIRGSHGGTLQVQANTDTLVARNSENRRSLTFTAVPTNNAFTSAGGFLLLGNNKMASTTDASGIFNINATTGPITVEGECAKLEWHAYSANIFTVSVLADYGDERVDADYPERRGD